MISCLGTQIRTTHSFPLCPDSWNCRLTRVGMSQNSKSGVNHSLIPWFHLTLTKVRSCLLLTKNNALQRITVLFQKCERG